MSVVKRKRAYNSVGRLEQARRSRELVVDVARRAFLEGGYAATTVVAIAGEAGVSTETIYKTFGGKAGLVRAIHQKGLAGAGPTPAPQRSDAMSAREADPRAILREWGRLTAEVSPLVSPILLVARAAAAVDADVAVLLKESDDSRLTRMRHNARVLAKRGFLREGVSVERAAEMMWVHTSPELYELLVIRRGWTATQFGDFVTTSMIGALLEAPRAP